MTQNWKYCSWQLGLANSLALLGALVIDGNYFANSVFAQSQIIADDTLGAERSYIDEEKPLGDNIDVLTGGATRGNNLFHSFKELNVNEERAALFRSPNSNIQNILVRVTGNSRSEIYGTLGTYQMVNDRISPSNANLFLINPRGIIFGPKSILNLGGSFIGSTASGIKFNDGTFFNATTLGTTPLLTVSVPVGLQIGKTVGEIKGQGQVVVQAGKTLALVGGNITLDNAIIQAESGQIALGGILGEGIIELNIDSNDRTLSFPNDVTLADVLLSNETRVTVSEDVNEDTVNDKGGGYIQLQGRDLILANGSGVFAGNRWSQNGRGISIQTEQLTLRDGSQISASTSSSGDGGSLTVMATDSVQVIGTFGEDQPNGLFTTTSGEGAAGNLTIETGKLIVENGGNIAVSTDKDSQGRGGILKVTASDSVKLSGTSVTTGKPSGLFAQTLGNGDAGSVTIDTKQLIAQDGAQVVSGNGDNSQGNGGGLTVFASDFVELSGKSSNSEDTSGLFARSRGSGDAGSISISTRQLIIRDQAQVTVSGIAAGTGTAGSLIVDANSIYLNNAAKITADTTGGGGDIFLRSPLLLLRNQSSITTNARGSGIPGGNIKIDATDGFIIAVPQENSDISANSVDFRGGKVEISAQGIFGIQRRNTPTPESDITATGVSPESSGSVEINTPDVDPNSGLVALPTVAVDTQIAQGCYSPGYAQNSFIITGRGGLPPNPREAFSSNIVRPEWATLGPSNDINSQQTIKEKPPIPTPSAPIVEATGWGTNTKGEIVLTANASAGTPHKSWQQSPVTCSSAKSADN
ncbi:filamentous hemagglutinin N-terminal domain-containing protein [Nostoc sp. FACHB-888]|uniref:two-partner secretion domain-containing protein n=1 Tax=Nostoc sp. FACHB-888 TaxID=2692842 RepID=UPI0016846605|nr:filamentous hemagglutinin N-terminal domain-containing protein [Nostoc sp. FACHB-888]MBD2248175.1 filamentous hemagglutinin N-terminal domain-containing protein [Nostoc sp. FACHB-888]